MWFSLPYVIYLPTISVNELTVIFLILNSKHVFFSILNFSCFIFYIIILLWCEYPRNIPRAPRGRSEWTYLEVSDTERNVRMCVWGGEACENVCVWGGGIVGYISTFFTKFNVRFPSYQKNSCQNIHSCITPPLLHVDGRGVMMTYSLLNWFVSTYMVVLLFSYVCMLSVHLMFSTVWW